MKLLDIQNYLKEYLRITRSSILTPETFFNEIRGEGRQYLKPFAYMLISAAFYFSANLLTYSLLDNHTRYFPQEIYLYFFIFCLIVWVLLLVLMPVARRLQGGKVCFNDIFKVICYSASVMNFAWIILTSLFLFTQYGEYQVFIILLLFLLLIDSFQYILYIIIVGISVTLDISKLRALASVIISFIIFSALIMSGLFVLDEMNNRPPPYNPPYNPQDQTPVPQEVPSGGIEAPPQIYNLTSYLGYAPVIDGMITENDRWSEGTRIPVYVRTKNYTITLKHDREFLYILMELESPVQWRDNITIYLEQDQGTPDFDMNTGRIKRYYQILNIETTELVDTYYDSGSFALSEHQDVSLKVNYFDGWIMEWKIPLNSGDKNDIYVDKYPTRLGFSMISEMRNEGGILPPSADFSAYIFSYTNYPQIWADLAIVDVRKP